MTEYAKLKRTTIKVNLILAAVVITVVTLLHSYSLVLKLDAAELKTLELSYELSQQEGAHQAYLDELEALYKEACAAAPASATPFN